MLCDTQQTENGRIATKKENDENELMPPSKLELENVHKVYNEIANHFSETRHSPWPQVETFVKEFDAGSVLVDIGCGNGKYLHLNENIAKVRKRILSSNPYLHNLFKLSTFFIVIQIGCDRSEGLLKVCRERGINAFQCDCLAVPIRTGSVDGIISIAVIHHLASKERRLKAISEMVRILRPSGRALIYVWAKNQALKTKSSYLRQNKKNNRDHTEPDTTPTIESKPSMNGLPVHTNRTQFVHQDILVPWKLKKSDDAPSDKSDTGEPAASTFLRYYHVFEENELESLCTEIDGITIRKSYYDQGNWCVIFEKM